MRYDIRQQLFGETYCCMCPLRRITTCTRQSSVAPITWLLVQLGRMRFRPRHNRRGNCTKNVSRCSGHDYMLERNLSRATHKSRSLSPHYLYKCVQEHASLREGLERTPPMIRTIFLSYQNLKTFFCTRTTFFGGGDSLSCCLRSYLFETLGMFFFFFVRFQSPLLRPATGLNNRGVWSTLSRSRRTHL